MLGEARVFLTKSWGASREEFYIAVDQVSRTMKQSGKLAGTTSTGLLTKSSSPGIS